MISVLIFDSSSPNLRIDLMKIVNNHGNIAISDNFERFHSPRIKPPRIAISFQKFAMKIVTLVG